MLSPTTSSASSSSTTSAFKRLCQAFSPKQSPRISINASSSSSSRKAFNDELIQRVFSYFDEDEDGKITAAELMTCMTAVGGREMSLSEAEMAVETVDSDGDGMLGLEDFSKILEDESGSEMDEMYAAFGMYAEEGSGSITPKSLKKMLSRLGQSTSVQSCRAIISKFDLNGDGVLNFDEFRLMMHGFRLIVAVYLDFFFINHAHDPCIIIDI